MQRVCGDIFNADVGNRQRNQWFNDIRRQTEQTRHGQPQRQRVGNGKHGDLPEQRTQMDAEQENAKDKQDVIQPPGQDMFKAEYDVGLDNSGDRLLCEYLGEREGLAVCIVTQPLPVRPVPLLVVRIDLADAHGVVAKALRVVPRHAGDRPVDLAFKVYDTNARYLGIADFGNINPGDVQGYALSVEVQFYQVGEFRLKGLECLGQIGWLHDAQLVVCRCIGGLPGVLVTAVDAGEQGLDTGTHLDAVGAVGIDADFHQRRFDHVGQCQVAMQANKH